MQVICNGSRACKKDTCFHKKIHVVEWECKEKCMNPKGVIGGYCMEIIYVT